MEEIEGGATEGKAGSKWKKGRIGFMKERENMGRNRKEGERDARGRTKRENRKVKIQQMV